MMAVFERRKEVLTSNVNLSLSVTSYGRNIIIKRGERYLFLFPLKSKMMVLYGFKLLYKQNGWVLIIQRVRLNTISIE